MSEPEAPTTEQPQPAPASKTALSDLFSQANITTALAVFAVVLAAAPYVAPQVQAWQTRAGLLAQPAMLQDASAALQKKANEDAMQATRDALKARAATTNAALYNNPLDPVLGNPKAAVKIVAFLDYNCGYCRAGTPQLKAFLAANPDVALIVKEYPVISDNSRPLAAFATAAKETGKYPAIHEAFMSSKISSEAELASLLTSIGLDLPTLKARAASKDIQSHIDDTLVLGNDLAISGTPTFIIEGEPISGNNFPAITAAVEKARKNGVKTAG